MGRVSYLMAGLIGGASATILVMYLVSPRSQRAQVDATSRNAVERHSEPPKIDGVQSNAEALVARSAVEPSEAPQASDEQLPTDDNADLATYRRQAVERSSHYDVSSLKLAENVKADLSRQLEPIERDLVDARIKAREIKDSCMQQKLAAGQYVQGAKGTSITAPSGAIVSGMRALPDRSTVFIAIMPGEFPELDAALDKQRALLKERTDVLWQFGVKKN